MRRHVDWKIALDPAGDDISLQVEKASLRGGDVYPHEDASLISSTAMDHTSESKVKQATSLLLQ